MDNLQKSILIVSEDAEFTRHMSEALGQDPGAKIASEVASFNGLNGKASRLAFKSDIVIFDANPADQDESKAISELLKNKTHETVFVALTDNEVSLIEARKVAGAWY